MKVRGIKASGFSRAIGGLRMPEVEMVSGCESFTRRGSELEFTIKLEAAQGHGAIRLTMSEAEVRDWHMRLGRALASIERDLAGSAPVNPIASAPHNSTHDGRR